MGDAHLCPRATSERGETKTTSVSSCLCRHSDHGVDTSTATPGGASAVGLFMFSSPGSHPHNPPLGALPLNSAQPMAGAQETVDIWASFDSPLLPTSQSSIAGILQPIAECKLLRDALRIEPQTGVEVQSYHAHI